MLRPTEPAESYGRLKLLIGGKEVDSASEEAHYVYNPAMGRAIAKVPFSLSEEVDAAVEAAEAAFDKWSEVPITERTKYLFRLKDAMEKHAEELAVLNTQNHGKTIEESRGDLKRTIENVDAAIAVAYTLSKGETLDQVSAGVDTSVSKEPLGVFTVICPFNFPLMIPFWFLPYAVVLGDTLVMKPSEITPVPMQRVAELIRDEVGLPPGVVNLVHGGRSVVEGLIAHRDVKGVTFVGSTPVARTVYKLAGENGKRAIVNGGAKNSLVVAPDADIDGSLSNMVSSVFGNTGQRCLAGANLIPVKGARESLVRKFTAAASGLRVGYGLREGVSMGPLVTGSAKKRVEGYIESGIDEGAAVASDGRGKVVQDYPDGFYLGPTVLDEVSPDMRVAKEEIFGPVASVVPAESLDEAIDTINRNTKFGNMACIYTTSGKNAREFRRRVNAGNVGVNIGVAAPSAYFPFGGRRESFYGVLHAQIDTVDFFTDKKVTISRW